MGGFSTKPKVQKKTIINSPQTTIQVLNNNKVFPSHIQKELLTVIQEFTNEKEFIIKRFDNSSSFFNWIRKISYQHPLFYQLEKLCYDQREGLHEYSNFISITLQDMADYFLVAFLPSGNIAGFSIIGTDIQRPNTLRRYMTCAGPKGVGIGYALVNEIHAIAREQGKNTVRLASATASSTAYHKRQGYILTGKKLAREGNEMIFTLPKRNNNTRKNKVGKNV